MRGSDQSGGSLFSYVDLEDRDRLLEAEVSAKLLTGVAGHKRVRKRIEEIFGWAKVQAGQAKTKFRGQRRVEASFILSLAAFNLIRLPKLLGAGP